MGYLKQTVVGTTWVGGFRVASRVIAFIKLGIIARILLPEQFGVYGIATLVLAFLEIFTETGVNTVLIQKKKSINMYINTAWCMSIVRGIFMAGVLFALSIPIASFFNNSDVVPLIRLISIVPLLRGFINPSVVKFQKELHFSREFWFRFVIFFLDALVAVWLVHVTRSPIGLIGGFAVGAVVEVILSFYFATPRPIFKFDVKQTREIVSKGKWVTGSRISEYLFGQGDDIIVGKLLNATSLGIYQAAYKISTLPVSEVADVIGKVTFPLFVKMSTDKIGLKNAYQKIVLVNFAAASILGLFVFVFSHEIIGVLLGSNWYAAEPLLKILAIFGVVKSITTSFYSLFYSRERQDVVTKITVINTVVLAILIIPSISLYGLLGAPYAVLVASLCGLPYAYDQQRKLLRESP